MASLRAKYLLLFLLVFFTCVWSFAESTSSGPTVLLSYEESTLVRNPIDVFMYFVPLTSPARVDLEKSTENSQVAWITGYKLRDKKESFRLLCDFTIEGDGYYANVFNHEDIIAYNTSFVDHPASTTNLDYMRFEGGGFGTIKIIGSYVDGNPEIKTLSIDFSRGRAKSPVIVGLYSLDPVDGSYNYENRYNHVKTRVNYLSFEATRPGESPKMQLKLSSFGNADTPDGFFSPVKALVANFFIPPIDVNPVGNGVLLDFAKALYQQKELFTFPFAESLEKER